MKFQDLTTLLEQDESIFKPRNLDTRKDRHEQQIQQQIQYYMKNSGEFDNLYLANTPIKSLPDGLRVGGDLNLSRTPIQT